MYYYKVTVSYTISGRCGEADDFHYDDTICRGLEITLSTATTMFERMISENLLDEFTDIRIVRGSFVNGVLSVDKEIFYGYRKYGKYIVETVDKVVLRHIYRHRRGVMI